VSAPGGASESARSFPTTPPERAAEIIIEGMERDQFQVYVGRDARMMNILYRLSPKRATRFMYNQMKSLLPR
jgi:short-subunit dehydrogenase